MAENQACCAHLHVEYRTEEVEHDFGPPQGRAAAGPEKAPSGVHRVTRGRWACRDCATKFSPVLSVASPLERATGSEVPTRNTLQLPHAIENAAIRFELLAGRFRGCDDTVAADFRHALSIEECEDFADETRDAVSTLKSSIAMLIGEIDRLRAAVLPSPEPT